MHQVITMKATLAALALVAAVPAAAATHPFSVRDMLAMDRISDPRVSPDGTQVVFTVRVTDLEANRGRTDLWIARVEGTGARRLTTHEAADSSGRFAPDGRSIYFLSTRGGSSQVYRLGLDGGEPEAVTNLPLDLDALEVAPGGRHLLFSMAVVPGKSPEETARVQEEKKKAKATGQVYDSLLFRHWDTWADGTRNHLFSYDLVSRRAVDLMGAMDADAPSKPFGGSEEFALSPDGQMVVFSARDAGRQEAWSTNFDLFEVPVDGSPGSEEDHQQPGLGHAAPLLSRRQDSRLARHGPSGIRSGSLRRRPAGPHVTHRAALRRSRRAREPTTIVRWLSSPGQRTARSSS